MQVLILGGTTFLGRHAAEEALRRGDAVTLFNRGRTAPDLFPEVELLRGDRDGDLAPLEGRQWDVVIDTSGYVPRIVQASAELLRGTVGAYVFVSSISAYADLGRLGLDESAPLATIADPSVEEIDAATYGPLKALCEQAVLDAQGPAAVIVRPGLIVGPHDPTDRFTYWVRRVADGGEVLAPGDPAATTQVIDARDLARWLLAVAAGGGGTYNAVGPVQPFGELLEACRRAGGDDARLTWVDEAFLAAHGVEPWTELPAWIPAGDGGHGGIVAVDGSRARARGLRHRPIAETVEDTLAWYRTGPAPAARAGLEPARERDLLAAWHTR